MIIKKERKKEETKHHHLQPSTSKCILCYCQKEEYGMDDV